MNKLNSKGFTLIELVATIVVLSIVLGISSYAITGVIKNSKEKNYQLLINEIKAAVEEYHIECNYSEESQTCSNTFTLGSLVTNGYLKGNYQETGGNLTLINPKDDEVISNCEITYSYTDGKYTIDSAQNGTSCPTNADFN